MSPAAVTALLPELTFLEAGSLPYSELARLASREGRRPRPIYQIHKWFARRLGCSFRALLVGAVQPDTADFWKAYYQTGNLSGLTVLDPFVGGGTSVVEAARLGATAIGIDVDPIACAVTRAELSASAISDLGPTLATLSESVGRSIARFHRTRAPDGTPLHIIHSFWVQTVTCPECGEQGEAHPHYLLADDGAKGRWAFCRDCHTVRRLTRGQKQFRCGSCETVTRLIDAPVRNGAFSCGHCSHRVPLIALGRDASRPPTWKLFALEASPRTSGRTVPMSERSFLRATPADRRTYARACAALRDELRRDGTFLPLHLISARHRTDDRLTDYGYRSWSQLFNDRQLLHLGLLARAIRALPDAQRVPLGLAFSNHLTTNCMLTSYAIGWRRLTPLFSVRAFRHIPRPVEVNPWSVGTGRGTFPNAVRQVERAAAYARSPKEPMRRGGFRLVTPVVPDKAPSVATGNARALTSVGTGTVDMVLTDPPYYDNVAYAELSEFFQPWLEHFGIVPKAATRRRLVRQALRARRRDISSIQDFADHLGEAFFEIHRVLKPRGLLAFTFRHSTSEAWQAMTKALAKSKLRAVHVLPMPGEAGTGLHAFDGTSLWDAVLVFRKLPAVAPTEMLNRKQVNAARRNASAWRDKLRRHHRLPFNDADWMNLFRASLVGASLGLYGPATGPRVSIRSALDSAGND